jgi:type II secretory pathway pseudopilin PulG
MDRHVNESKRDEAGDSLIEILVSIIVIGILVGALLSAYATASLGSKSGRDLVTADAVLRDYAERTKAAVRTSCPSGSTYTVTYSAPSGFTPLPTPGSSRPCPASATTVLPVDLSVTMPNGNTKALSIIVRTP